MFTTIMDVERNRWASFKGWRPPHNFNISTRQIANNGYYMIATDKICCFHCHREVESSDQLHRRCICRSSLIGGMEYSHQGMLIHAMDVDDGGTDEVDAG